MGEGHDAWYLMVYPARDIFCVTLNNWEFVERALENSNMFYNFPFLGIDWAALRVENLALEFDPSWNHALPKHIYDLRMEESPRGLLAKLIDEMVYWLSFTGLWLVDKSVHWWAEPDRDYSTVFYDCDGEYVAIGWDDTYSDHSGTGAGQGPVTYFIRKLARLCDSYYTDLSRGDLTPGYHEELVHQFSVKASVRLLVRRDKKRSETDSQVMEDENENMVMKDEDAMTDDEGFSKYML
ncbi:hypothetical protein NW767_008755 [Fusarium falciforme]|nr:hypothetical protein NW767_008755 [Fusarium falciforme]